jgi:predicted PurR-regulated permease PerM
VRQVVQPKVLGDQIGIHPLATMITMYAGFKFFGLSGLIFGPIVFVIVKSILGYYTRGRSFKQLIFGDGS